MATTKEQAMTGTTGTTGPGWATITTEGGRLMVTSPFHPRWAPRARALGGRWDAAAKAWTFDPRDEERVRAAAVAVYGTDGDDDAPRVTVRVDLDAYGARDGAELWVGPRQVARRPGRDERVRLGDGVVLVSGGFAGSGGSVRYPQLAPRPGTVVEVRDLPAPAVAALADAAGVEVVADPGATAQLRAERARLAERLAAVDALLAAAGGGADGDGDGDGAEGGAA